MKNNADKKKLILFDLDGTILDTSEGLLASTVYTIRRLGYELPGEEILNSFVGPRIQDSLNRVFGLEGEKLKEASEIFRNRYKEGDVLKAVPYEGICDVMKALYGRGVLLGVATNKRQDFAEALLSGFGFDSYIACTAGTDLAGKLKKEDLIRACLERFALARTDHALMVGDSGYDAAAAKNAGVPFLGVTYGFDFKTQADVSRYPHIGVADSVGQLGQFLTEWAEKE